MKLGSIYFSTERVQKHGRICEVTWIEGNDIYSITLNFRIPDLEWGGHGEQFLLERFPVTESNLLSIHSDPYPPMEIKSLDHLFDLLAEHGFKGDDTRAFLISHLV